MRTNIKMNVEIRLWSEQRRMDNGFEAFLNRNSRNFINHFRSSVISKIRITPITLEGNFCDIDHQVLAYLMNTRSWVDVSMASNPSSGGNINASSISNKIPPNGWTRKERPCDHCRRRKSRCIIPQDAETCIMCQSRGEQCTFVENPQRRKRRKLEDDSTGSPDTSKPRSVPYNSCDIR